MATQDATQNAHGATMTLYLQIWRQPRPDKVNDGSSDTKTSGRMVTYTVENVSEHMSFLEMLDVLNTQLIEDGTKILRRDKNAANPESWALEPIAFDHDCREGICGSCSMMIGGSAHGPHPRTTACQLHMRTFNNGDTITVEPWRASAFPVIKDLVVDRSSFDRIIQAGGYVSVGTGGTPDGNAVPISKPVADKAMDAAECIGCGACVAACPNASAMLFTSAKIAQLSMLPQGQAERDDRVVNMVSQMEDEGFGNCTNHGECATACPKSISLDFISLMNRELYKANKKSLLG